jgi:hypothetical protein
MDFIPAIILAAVVIAFKFGLLAMLFKLLKSIRTRLSGFFGNPDGI